MDEAQNSTLAIVETLFSSGQVWDFLLTSWDFLRLHAVIIFQPNQVLKFTDTGDTIDTIAKQKVSLEGREYDSFSAASTKDQEVGSSGIDLELARKVLKAEDAFDRVKEKERVKERHKEQKRKEKELKNSRRKEIEEAKAAAETGGDAEVSTKKVLLILLFLPIFSKTSGYSFSLLNFCSLCKNIVSKKQKLQILCNWREKKPFS